MDISEIYHGYLVKRKNEKSREMMSRGGGGRTMNGREAKKEAVKEHWEDVVDLGVIMSIITPH